MQRVVVKGELSKPARIASGVPQCSMLSPLLFLIYLNDLPSQVQSQTRLFDEDYPLYQTMQMTLLPFRKTDALQHWEKQWHKDFYPDKCEIIHITNKMKIISAKFTLRDRN